jgi:hypothetical protein
MTTDGLFVCSLFGDMRLAPLEQSATEARRGMPMQQYSLNDECFHGWFGRADDGRVLQVLGKSASSVFEVRGLDTLRRLDGGLVRLRKAARAAASRPGAPRPVVEAKLGGRSGLGGGGVSDGWRKLRSYPIPAEEPVARFALAASPDYLQLWVEVNDASPFRNSGGDVAELFRTGDAIDFRFAADRGLPPGRKEPGPGDQRFVIAMHGNKPVVVRYRFVVPGAAEPKTFTSPTGSTTVDDIQVLETARVTIDRKEKSYRVVVNLSWKELGLDSHVGGDWRGDVGVILSDPTGARTVERRYYYDRNSSVVSDLSSEARVSPARWGTIRF